MSHCLSAVGCAPSSELLFLVSSSSLEKFLQRDMRYTLIRSVRASACVCVGFSDLTCLTGRCPLSAEQVMGSHPYTQHLIIKGIITEFVSY